MVEYLWDWAVEVLHVITKAGSKLAENFFVPSVVLHVDFRLNLESKYRKMFRHDGNLILHTPEQGFVQFFDCTGKRCKFEKEMKKKGNEKKYIE